MALEQQSSASIDSPAVTTVSGVRLSRSDAQSGGAGLARVERVLSAVAFLWVLVIGIQTQQVPTHLMEALPLLALLFAPRTTWVRTTAIVVGFSWMYMLIAVTPEFRDAILGWQAGTLGCWLAPTMVAVCTVWMAANLAILRGRDLAFWGYLAGCVVLIPPLCFLNHYCMEFLLFPLQQVVAGQYVWALALVASSFVMVACVIMVTKVLTNVTLDWSRRIACGNAVFWLFFVTCMIVSQLPGIKHY